MRTTIDRGQRGRPFAQRVGPRALAGGMIAAVAAAGLLLVAHTKGERLEVRVPGRVAQEIALGAVVIVTASSAAAAWLTAAVLSRIAPRPRRTFIGAATLVLAVSLLPVASAATGAAVWWLVAMHLVVFTLVVGALAPVIPSHRAARPTPTPAPRVRVHGGPA